MEGETNNNGWTEWRKHVLLEIERINTNLEKMDERHIKLSLEVAKLKAYTAIWGALGGAVITLVAAIIVMRF